MGTHPIFESDFDCLTECYALCGVCRLCTGTRGSNLTTTFPTTRNRFRTSSTSNNTSICSKALISEMSTRIRNWLDQSLSSIRADQKRITDWLESASAKWSSWTGTIPYPPTDSFQINRLVLFYSLKVRWPATFCSTVRPAPLWRISGCVNGLRLFPVRLDKRLEPVQSHLPPAAHLFLNLFSWQCL